MERMILLMVSVQEVAGSSIVGMVTAGATLTTMGSMLTLTAFLFAPITQCHIGGTAGFVGTQTRTRSDRKSILKRPHTRNGHQYNVCHY